MPYVKRGTVPPEQTCPTGTSANTLSLWTPGKRPTGEHTTGKNIPDTP
jgi:hypothetical protein